MVFPSRQVSRQLRQFGHESEDRVAHQLTALRHEVAGLSNALRHLGAGVAHDFGHEASHLTGEMLHQGVAVAKVLGRQASKAGTAMRADPVPAIVAVAGFVLFLNLILGRK